MARWIGRQASRLMTDLIGEYRRLSVNGGDFLPANIQSYTPQITEEDRYYGEIIRYFVRFTTHTSPADIIEVNKSNYNQLKSNKFYTLVDVRWKVSGVLDDEYGLTDDNISIRLVTGVVTANKLSIELANETLMGIKDIIVDYKRFWQF